MMRNKTKIAFLTHGDRNIGGGENSWYFLITKINRNFFNPIVFYSTRNRIIDQIKDNNIPVIYVPIDKRITSIYRDQVRFNPVSFIKYFYYLLIASIRLFKKLRIHKVKKLHVHDNLSKIIGIPAAKLAGIKIITHCNDQLGKSVIDRILLFFQKYFIDKVFCVSNIVGNSFAINGKIPDRFSVIYSGIEINKWKKIKKNKQKQRPGDFVNIGMVAVFDGVKGHIYLFKAIKLLLGESITNFFCEIIGDGRERSSLHKWVLSNGIEQYINFKGFVPNLKEELENIDVLIVPSLQESFGMSAVEAMAMEIPVIASDVGGLTEVVDDGNTGILVPLMNPNALAAAIKYLLNNPKIRIKMGINGKKRVRKMFDINKNIRITEKIIWNMVNSNDYPRN